MSPEKEPLVSILMTVYNREKFIAEAVESALSSSLKDFELIIVDDVSSDNSLAIAEKYRRQDERIRVYKNEKNLGDYPNRNKAASYARGKYLKYLDADDIIYPEALEYMVDAMERFPQAGLGLSLKDFSGSEPIYFDARKAIRTNFLSQRLFLSSPLSSIIRRSTFEKVGGFSGKRFVGDTELWIVLAAESGLLQLKAGYAHWRSHDEQESKSEAKNVEGIIARYRFAYESLDKVKNFFSKEEMDAIRRVYDRNFARHFFRKIKSGEYNVASAIKKESKKSFFSLIKDSLAAPGQNSFEIG